MKNLNLFLALFFCCSLGTSLMAQATFGVKAGVNAAQSTGNTKFYFDNAAIVEEDFEVRLKPQLGVWYNIPLGTHFSMQPEFLWTQKSLLSDVFTEEVVLDYFSLPVLFNYKFRNFTIELGPELSFLMDQRFANKDLPMQEVLFIEEQEFECAANLGLRYQINRWGIGLRASHDITHFLALNATDFNGEPVADWKYFHRGLQLSLGYKLF